MALTPQVRLSQSTVRSVAVSAVDLRVSQAVARVIYNIPTEHIRLSQTVVRTVGVIGVSLRVTQALIRVIAAGRTADPTVRAWTFTLDGHDFYVIRLGDDETLVYDLATEQWVNWDSHGLPFWRLNSGITWVGGQSLGFEYGSSIVVGDDLAGLLWVLNPERSYDESVAADAPEQIVKFTRVVTGQVAMTGRQVLPCYAIFLIGDNFGPLTDEFTPSVTLSYSDDAGKTYDIADTITVTPETVDQSYEWLSLGQIEAPGRIFRITDDGVFTRIDSMTMNDD